MSSKSLEWKYIWDKLNSKGVTWKHIPPFSSAQKELWEMLVGMSYFKKVESILNWHSPTALSDDHNDFQCLSRTSLLNSGIHASVPLGKFVKDDRMCS